MIDYLLVTVGLILTVVIAGAVALFMFALVVRGLKRMGFTKHVETEDEDALDFGQHFRYSYRSGTIAGNRSRYEE